MGELKKISKEISGDIWIIKQVYDGSIGELYYTKNGELLCTATLTQPLSTEVMEECLMKFVDEQDPITQAVKEVMAEEEHRKELINRIVNSKSKIKTSNFQGKNSLQAYLNGKAQREQEIISIVNDWFEGDI